MRETDAEIRVGVAHVQAASGVIARRQKTRFEKYTQLSKTTVQ